MNISSIIFWMEKAVDDLNKKAPVKVQYITANVGVSMATIIDQRFHN